MVELPGLREVDTAGVQNPSGKNAQAPSTSTSTTFMYLLKQHTLSIPGRQALCKAGHVQMLI
jgi:hypothetical protein